MTTQDCDDGIKYMASLVLKNTLRNHVVTYKANGGLDELNAVKKLLFTRILALPNPQKSQKKLLKEARQILSRVAVQEYYDDQASIADFVNYFCQGYNPVIVKLVNQIFKEAKDDRMSALVHKLLTATQKYILDEESSASTDCNLIELVVQMFQCLEIAKDTDPDLIV